MPTIKGLRRRGYTKEAIIELCDDIGINIGGSSGCINMTDWRVAFERFGHKAARRMAIMNPLKITIVNWPNKMITRVAAKDYPSLGNNSPTRTITCHPTSTSMHPIPIKS